MCQTEEVYKAMLTDHILQQIEVFINEHELFPGYEKLDFEFSEPKTTPYTLDKKQREVEQREAHKRFDNTPLAKTLIRQGFVPELLSDQER